MVALLASTACNADVALIDQAMQQTMQQVTWHAMLMRLPNPAPSAPMAHVVPCHAMAAHRPPSPPTHDAPLLPFPHNHPCPCSWMWIASGCAQAGLVMARATPCRWGQPMATSSPTLRPSAQDSCGRLCLWVSNAALWSRHGRAGLLLFPCSAHFVRVEVALSPA